MSVDQKINIKQMPFPLITFFGVLFGVKQDPVKMCEWNALSLKRKNYKKILYVDSTLNSYRIADARFVSGRGPFWGYNLGFNRLINVDIDFVVEGQVTLDEVKYKMFDSFKKWEDWDQDPNYPKIRLAIKTSESMASLLKELASLM